MAKWYRVCLVGAVPMLLGTAEDASLHLWESFQACAIYIQDRAQPTRFSFSPLILIHQAHKRLFDMKQACVQLEHEHGSENDPDLVFSNGNDEPHRGFGHLAFLTADVYQASEDLEKVGVSFKKKPGDAGVALHERMDVVWVPSILFSSAHTRGLEFGGVARPRSQTALCRVLVLEC